MHSKYTAQKGFSLVELSIVLVILGLLTGGILSGQSLIRAAEVRAASTEFQRYTAAIYTFRDKYFALPGDFNKATDFWGEADADQATCETTPSTGTETCNGNGDGQVLGVAPNHSEPYRVWQHLANASLIEGQYTGADATLSGGASAYVAGINMPASKIPNGFWLITWQSSSSGSLTNFAYSAGHMLRITGGVMTPEECWNVDTKLDDGKPATGKVRGFKGSAAIPVTTRANQPAGPADLAAEYNFAFTSKSCNPMMYF